MITIWYRKLYKIISLLLHVFYLTLSIFDYLVLTLKVCIICSTLNMLVTPNVIYFRGGIIQIAFLAPSGAQEIQMFVCLSDEKCSRAYNIHLSLSGQSKVSLRSLSSYFIGQTEPKILRLVYRKTLLVCLHPG